MTFMSSKEICQCIRSGKIKIAYYAIQFDPEKSEKIGQKIFVKPDPDENDTALDKAIRDYFFDSLKGDSLYFHTGPYVKIEYLTNLQRRRFRDGKTDVISLEKIKSLVVASGEHLVISTNEYIELSDDVGASICATVSKTDVGFSHVSTIIDPLWRGNLQIGMSNLSRRGCTLKYLDNLCSVRFHYLEGEIDGTWERRRNWKHFANNYFEEDKQPKIPISSEELDNIVIPWRDIALTRQEWETFIKRLCQGLGVTAALVTITFLNRLHIQLQTLSSLSENLRINEAEIGEVELNLARVQKDLDTLNTRIDKVENMVVASGEAGIAFSSLKNTEELRIPMSFLLSDESVSDESVSIYVLFKGISSSNLTYEVVLPEEESTVNSQSRKKEAILQVQYLGEVAEGEEISGTVEWIVAR
ncbi:hypothetical protein [Phormidium sp. FACHB-1136]|uniref:hypothetical protein n=1 Tax=Phormidium sp. FACHB-1136 TaxID=2692848 RepID=UPI001687926A|nr:hypothetical protein [Phormidium sp. FACHB-1136]MBD2426150.1 hypothetical protein [Phormidium sp. FACHB-1136]